MLVFVVHLAACGEDPGARPDRIVDQRDSGLRCLGGDGPSGSPCRCDSDCQLGRCLPQTNIGAPQPICVELCSSDTDCGAGNRCVGSLGTGVCLEACSTSSECPPGLLCFVTHGACLPWCTRDEDCAVGRCDQWSGRCGDTAEGLVGVDELCLEHRDCRSGLCDPERDRCITFCALGGPPCPDDTACSVAPGAASYGVGLCTRRCMITRDCPEGTSCVARDDELLCLETEP
jgi:hypothetical protein